MTLTDLHADPIAAPLLAALDAPSEDDAWHLTLVADYLEEVGDGRAAGLREAVRYLPALCTSENLCCWLPPSMGGPIVPAGRLYLFTWHKSSRSDALLALAEALAGI